MKINRIRQIALLTRVIGSSMQVIGSELVKVSNAVVEVSESFEAQGAVADPDDEF